MSIRIVFVSVLLWLLAGGSQSVAQSFEPVFDCSDIIGKVFADKNHNGMQEQGEEGIGGVRVVSVRGLVAQTDRHGRYSLPCLMYSAARTASSVIVKLDRRSLPVGYQVISENPRVVHASRGRVVKMNFSVSKVAISE